MEKIFATYIITNNHHTTFYTGFTNNLERRIFEHKNKLVKGFSSKYNTVKLVYYELHDTAENAIKREKRIKGWRQQSKIDLIVKINPDFVDLSLVWND